MTDYEKIRLLLALAKEARAKGEITLQAYSNIVKDLDAFFLDVQKQIEEEEFRELFSKYIANLS